MIENISIENSDKFSVLLLSLKNFNIIQFNNQSAETLDVHIFIQQYFYVASD